MRLKCVSLHLVASRWVVLVANYRHMMVIETGWIAILSTISLYLLSV